MKKALQQAVQACGGKHNNRCAGKYDGQNEQRHEQTREKQKYSGVPAYDFLFKSI